MLAASLVLILTAQQPERCSIPAHWGIQASQPGLVVSGNRITIEDKGIRWNGVPVDDATFRLYLRSAARISPRPRLIIPAHDMPCEAIQSLAAVIEQAAPCDPDVCVVSWDQPPPPPPPPPAPPRRF